MNRLAITPTQNIVIQQISPTKKKDENNEYSLKHSIFDPSNSSPPNNFMSKLHLRMSQFNSSNSLSSLTKT